MWQKIKNEVLDSLNNVIISGQRGWYLADCPYCKKKQHLGVIFGKKIASFVCFKCGEKGTLYKLLRFIDKYYIIEQNKTIDFSKSLENKLLLKNQEIEIDLDMPTIDLPIGFKKINSNKYLESRGITKFQFELFEIGVSNVDPKYSNYIIFPIKNEQDKYIGYISRTVLSKFTINKIEQKTYKKYIRYKNSLNTDFSKYLFGLNEIQKNSTNTVILVEGIFDKFNVDNLLNLYSTNDIKCCACFGKKVSLAQIFRLQKKCVKNIILIYDNDAVTDSKKYAFELSKYFNVSVGFCKSKDPGEVKYNELLNIINNAESPTSFNFNKVNKINLK